MSKFNSVILKAKDGTQVHFVTRGKAKAPTNEEVSEYFAEHNLAPVDEEKLADDIKNWKPASDKMLLLDLRQGLVWCSNKYGVSESVIQSYIERTVPHLNQTYYRRENDKKI